MRTFRQPAMPRGPYSKFIDNTHSVSVHLGWEQPDDPRIKINPRLCPRFAHSSSNPWACWPSSRFGEYRRPQELECPTCGRRVTAKVDFCHDGDCMYFLLPIHKRKHWWKRGVKDKRKHRDQMSGRGK